MSVQKGRSHAIPRTKARPKTHRRWKCPGKRCDGTYKSPIPVIEVWCSNVDKHSQRTPIQMRPDDPES